MTTREIYGKGLIAGLTYTEMRHMFPGFILDQYIWRSKYDAAMAAPKFANKLLGGA